MRSSSCHHSHQPYWSRSKQRIPIHPCTFNFFAFCDILKNYLLVVAECSLWAWRFGKFYYSTTFAQKGILRWMLADDILLEYYCLFRNLSFIDNTLLNSVNGRIHLIFVCDTRHAASTGPLAHDHLIWPPGHLVWYSTGPAWPPKFKGHYNFKKYNWNISKY